VFVVEPSALILHWTSRLVTFSFKRASLGETPDVEAVSGQCVPVCRYTCAFIIGLGPCGCNKFGNLGRSLIQLAPAILVKQSGVIDVHLAAQHVK